MEPAAQSKPKPPAESKADPGDVSLTEFIEENQRTISVLGVFTALTVFSRQLPLRVLSDILSFLFLAATVLLWFELLGRYPAKSSSFRMSMFESILSLAIMVLVFYWLVLYREFWRHLLVLLFFAGLSTLLTKVMQHYNVFNRVFNAKQHRRRGLRHLLYFVLQGLILVTSMMLAALLGIPANRWLDETRTELAGDSAYTSQPVVSNRAIPQQLNDSEPARISSSRTGPAGGAIAPHRP